MPDAPAPLLEAAALVAAPAPAAADKSVALVAGVLSDMPAARAVVLPRTVSGGEAGAVLAIGAEAVGADAVGADAVGPEAVGALPAGEPVAALLVAAAPVVAVPALAWLPALMPAVVPVLVLAVPPASAPTLVPAPDAASVPATPPGAELVCATDPAPAPGAETAATVASPPVAAVEAEAALELVLSAAAVALVPALAPPMGALLVADVSVPGMPKPPPLAAGRPAPCGSEVPDSGTKPGVCMASCGMDGALFSTVSDPATLVVLAARTLESLVMPALDIVDRLAPWLASVACV